MRSSIIAAGFSVAATMAAAETPVLTVLTYDSFATEWGPGPAVETAFEADCGCDLRFVTAGDGAALLARVRLEGARSEADVVVGLDTRLTAAAAATGLFAPHGLSARNDLPVAYADPLFVPFDWGWFAFVYDQTKLRRAARVIRGTGGFGRDDRDSGSAVIDPRTGPSDVGEGGLWRPGAGDLARRCRTTS